MTGLGVGRRRLAAVVALVLVASGCTKASKGSGSHTAVPSTSTPAAASNAATPATPDATIRTLADAGVATVADETATSARVPVTGATAFRVTTWQADTMARENAVHGGITGSDLDAMLPTPGAPPLADILGAWVSSKADPAAVAAAQVLGPVDWRQADQVVFPSEVLDLFVADALQHVTASSSSDSSAPSDSGAPSESSAPSDSSAPPDSGVPSDSGTSTGAHDLVQPVEAGITTTPCSTISNFVGNVLTTIFNALKLDPATVAAYVSGTLGGGVVGTVLGGIAGWAATFWNGLVNAGESAARAVLSSLTQPVLNVLRLVLGGLATITMIASYLKRWNAAITPTPSDNKFAITPKVGNPGSFTVNIDTNAETADWPPQLVDCAQAAGVPLPTLSKAGLPVNWKVLDNGLVTVAPHNAVLSQALSNTLSYTTGTEDAKTASSGVLVTPTVTATVSVRRTEVDDLRRFVTAFAMNQIPKIIAPVVNPIVSYYVELATKQLDRITAVEGSSTIVVTHHLPQPPKPKPSPGTCTTSGTAIPSGTYAGTIRATITTKLHITVPGAGTIPNAGGGSLPVYGPVHLVSNGTKVSGTLKLSGNGTSHVGLPGATNVHSHQSGSLVSTISGTASAPIVTGAVSGEWASLDAPLGNSGGSDSNHVRVGLHITRADCTSISGDAVLLFRELAAPVAQYLTIGGSGAWTAKRS